MNCDTLPNSLFDGRGREQNHVWKTGRTPSNPQGQAQRCDNVQKDDTTSVDKSGSTDSHHANVDRTAPPHKSTSFPTTTFRPSKSVMNLRMTPNVEGDIRRNLYVLGLPFDLTKAEFIKLFSPFGTVSHAVILATVDSASRRRGFIVMSTHEEAKAAMNELSRTQIKGHTLDVSWAVVQRSQGFLDGEDRTMALAVSSSMSDASAVHTSGLVTSESDGHVNNFWNFSHKATSTLLVCNLPTLLFAQVSDLHPLFYPFGAIKDIRIAGPFHGSATIAAVAEYVNISSAQEAKESLELQSYAGRLIDVYYICDDVPTAREASVSSSELFATHRKGFGASLNPFATPFAIGTYSSQVSRATESTTNFGYASAIPSGLPGVTPPFAPRPLPIRMTSYTVDAISRSSSATSSNWSQEYRPFRASRPSYSSTASHPRLPFVRMLSPSLISSASEFSSTFHCNRTFPSRRATTPDLPWRSPRISLPLFYNGIVYIPVS